MNTNNWCGRWSTTSIPSSFLPILLQGQVWKAKSDIFQTPLYLGFWTWRKCGQSDALAWYLGSGGEAEAAFLCSAGKRGYETWSFLEQGYQRSQCLLGGRASASIFFAEVDPAGSVWLGSRQLWWQPPDPWITAKAMCSYGQELPSQLHDRSASWHGAIVPGVTHKDSA